MSPFVLDRNVPLIGPPKGGQIGADRDEQEGVAEEWKCWRGCGASNCGSWMRAADAGELSTGEAIVEALSGRRSGGSEASQRGTTVESRTRAEVSAEGAAAGAGEVRRGGGRAFRADAGGGALGVRGRAEGRCGDAAAVDAGGEDCGVGSGSDGSGTGDGASARSTLGRWCRWTGAFTPGWRSVDRRAA